MTVGIEMEIKIVFDWKNISLRIKNKIREERNKITFIPLIRINPITYNL